MQVKSRATLTLLAVTAALALLGLPTASSAQHWATKEACAVDPDAPVDWADFAPFDAAEARARAAEIPNGTGRFWRIEGGGAPSYIWGTVHANDPALLDLPDPVIEAIRSARVLMPEIDPIYPSRRAMEADWQNLDRYRNPRVVFHFDDLGLDPAINEVIRQRMHGLGYGREGPDYLTLGALAETLLFDPCDDFAYGTLPSQDGRIQMLAMIEGAEIAPLEASNRISDYLNRRDNEATALAFVEVFGAYLLAFSRGDIGPSPTALYLSGQIGLWMVQDEAVARRYLGGNRGAALLKQLDDYLLVERNHLWMERLEEPLQEGNVFIAVGTFHLPGKDGMIALIRDAGYEVIRIPVSGEVE